MKNLLNIARFMVFAILLYLLQALAPAMAQSVVYTGDITPLGVIEEPGGYTYQWELYDNGSVDFVTVPGNCPATSAMFIGGNIGATVNVQWLKAGIYYFKANIYDASGCAKNFKIGVIEVKESLPKASITPPDPTGICAGITVGLEVNITGPGPWNLIYTDGTNSWIVTGITESPYILKVNPMVTTTYRISEVSNKIVTNTEPSEAVTQKVFPLPILVIQNPEPVCYPATIDLTDQAIFTGSDPDLIYEYFTDSAATISIPDAKKIAESGTFYVKATNATTGCYVTKSIAVTIYPLPVVVITDPAAVCQPNTIDLEVPAITSGSEPGLSYSYYIDSLTTTSLLNFNAVSTSGKYFIKATNPATGCSVVNAVKVTINPLPILVITDPPEKCFPSTIDLSSEFIIDGSSIPPSTTFSYWMDAAATNRIPNEKVIAVSGTYYIRAVEPGGCSSEIRAVNVIINSRPNLVITNPTPACEPATVNISLPEVTAGSDLGLIYEYYTDLAASSPLPNPEAIDASGTFYIKAINSSSGCSEVKPVVVVVNELLTPEFPTINELCINEIAPTLATVSTNGISGKWSPSTVDTSIPGTLKYTFTPDDSQCSVLYEIDITITDRIYSRFAPIGPFCVGSSASLPSTSTNGVTGTWSPSTISTVTSGLFTFQFIPVANECALDTTLQIEVNDPITPSFDPIEACQNTTTNPLPAKSNEGISGTWSPTFSSAIPGAAKYTFTPYPDQCAKTTNLTININQERLPEFAPIGPFCVNLDPPPSLPLTSMNGMNGTWTPAVVSTSTIGTSNYLFTPDGGTCGLPISVPIKILGLSLNATTVDLGYSTLPIGEIDLTVSDGSGDYSYSWTGPNGFTSSSQDLVGLAVGDYTIVVTDIQTTCNETKTIPIKSSFFVDYTYDPASCFGRADGKASAIIYGGTPPYHYSWKKDGVLVSTDQTATNLIAGNYTIEATDNNGLSMVKSVIITQPERLQISTTLKNVSCFGANDGAISVSVSGGPSGAETVIWINGLKVTSLTGLSKGAYVIHIENTCGRDTVVNITEPPVMTLKTIVTDAICFGTPGNIQLTTTQVPEGIYEVIYDGGQFSGVQISSNLANIPALDGTYKNLRLLVDECLVSGGDVTINNPPEIIVTATVTAQPNCIDTTGVIRLSPSPAPGLTYSIDGTNYTNTTGIFTGLPAGKYTGMVKNSNGCYSSPSNKVTINEQPLPMSKPIAQVSEQPNCEVTTGTITVISPRDPDLTYSIDGVTFTNTTGIFTGLSLGDYQITAKGLEGCISVISDKISIIAQLVAVSAPIAIPVAAECEQSPMQKIYASSGIVTPPSGITLNWYNEQGAPVIDPYLDKVGSVTYFAETANGVCISSTRTAVTLTINPAPTVLISQKPIPECEASPMQTMDARTYISDVPGTTISWWDAATGGNKVANPILNATGTKTFYAEASNGQCASPTRTGITLTINSLPASPEAMVTASPTCNFPNGTVVVTSPKEGTGFEYNIDGGTYQTSATFPLLKWGNHLIRVKKTSTGCESETATLITIDAIPPAPILTVAKIEHCICPGGDGSISFNATNTINGVYKITFDGGSFENVSFNGGLGKVITSAGVYNNLTIDANGCTSEAISTVKVNEPELISITESVIEIDLKSGRKGAIDLHVNGGTASYSYLWSNGETTEDIMELNDGTYTVIVTDINGCKMQKTITIPIPNFSPVANSDVFTVGCDNITGDLISNDFDPEGNSFYLDPNPVEKPLHGSLTLNADGTFEYQPDLHFTGTDYFRYAIYDIKHYLGDTATVVLNIIGDFDCDGTADETDPDIDGDGILNDDEGVRSADNDGDGVPNYLDIDSDNDGIVDNVEAQSSIAYIAPLTMDSDGDGLDDAYDPDQKGIVVHPVDTDNDEIHDFLDSDSDDDLVPDYIEGHDLLGDGKADYSISGKDSDHDGLDDAYDTVNRYTTSGNMTGSNATRQDFDGDGKPDWRDENDDDDLYLTRFEDLNADGNFSNDDIDKDGHPEYLDYGRDCDLFIPDIFTPNNDNIHDYFVIYCIDHYPDAKIYIFDQNGNKIFEKEHYGNLEYWGSASRAWWNGRNMFNGNVNSSFVPIGTYYYVLILGNGEVKKSYVFVSY